MNLQQLNGIWHAVQTVRPSDVELHVHAIGVRSVGFDLCVGWDGQSRRHFLVPLPEAAAFAPTFKSAGLFVRTRTLLRDGVERSFLDLVCLSPALNEVFSHLVLDVLQSMRADEPDAAGICLRVLEEWKELFGSGTAGLSRERITGLVGELIVLDRLTRANPATLASWDGPLGGIHDFRSGRTALEVKASTRRHGRFFSITGHQQLEAPSGGDLYFAALKLEHNPGGAHSIRSLIDRIRRNGVEPSLLQQRLSEAGYRSDTSEQVDNILFDLLEFRLYRVDDQFPRLIDATFSNGHLPAGVVKISYEIDLTGEHPSPLPPEATQGFFDSFAAGGYR